MPEGDQKVPRPPFPISCLQLLPRDSQLSIRRDHQPLASKPPSASLHHQLRVLQREQPGR